MRSRLAIRVDAANPDHHLFRQSDGWWVRYTVRRDDGTSVRQRHSLATGDLDEARQRRDALFARLDQPATMPPGGAATCTFAELDQPDSIWNRAAANSGQLDPFCCRTEWALSYHESMEPQRPLHVHANDDSVLAFAENLDPRFGVVLEPVESSWLFGSPLLGQTAVELLRQCIDDPKLPHHRATLILSGLQPLGPQLAEVVMTIGARYRFFRVRTDILCSASLDGGIDGYLGRRSKKLRRNLQKAARHAADLGVTYERHVPEDGHQTTAIYLRMLAIERVSWKGIGRCGMAEPPSLQFYDRMLRRLAISGGGRVIFARHDGRDIGFIFGGRAGAVYRGQQFSFDQNWHRQSIGNLLQIEQLTWLCEEGAERYDMGPKMDYKRHWTEIERPIEALLLQPH